MTTQENSLSLPEGKPVEITIDGRSFVAPEGANLLQFMLSVGLEISYFCYHPGLSVVAVCRQCLVELKGMPKLQPACQTPIRAGLVVDSSNPRVLEARRQLLEFTLVNHPVDCPICDKAGECILQRHYMDYNHGASRVDHAKVHKPKTVDLGPRVVLDDERCIHCTRCARYMREVVKEPQLTMARRGNHTILTVAPGTRFDSNYSLNTVDICPVGALTDKDFRFKIRVWELSATNSICTGCATGCRLEIHHHRGEVKRLVPRRFKDINLNWMCDFGRYTYKALSADRLTLPRLKGQECGWDEALAFGGGVLARLAEKTPDTIGVVLGADATNEDNYLFARLARDFVRTSRVYLAAEPDGQADTFLRSADPNPNRAGAVACGGSAPLLSMADLAQDLGAGRLKALIVLGEKLHLPDAALSALKGLELVAVLASHKGPLVERSNLVLPLAMWAEVDGTLTNAKGETQRLRAAVPPAGAARPGWQIGVGLARRAGFTLEYATARAIHEAMNRETEFFRNTAWGKDLPATPLRYAGTRG